ncbi:7-carboxy-7-deazaguanine synthase QueE [Gabonibacter chumensis]|uniref:7-carboxy-7-deazaguanine synthase QueE n=1 Tax=Gabonibacter chumensis TaxID=2972474 RepID=UPI00257327AD|nr:7-carboxy-7-deazaguanine synthase QueE [Gabonibacter chumensis]MCR9012463.1 7-carboxy-7-deazaguanine synthase QueE [Gabonibacter chumensis]
MVENVKVIRVHSTVMFIQLAKDGIFPITRDKAGNPLKKLPASGFTFPGTIQGEGKLNGIPSLFIRLAGCNLHCCWQTPEGVVECDTAYAAFKIEESFRLPVPDIIRIVKHNRENIRHIIITGGEPFLQAEGVLMLCRELKKENPFHITVETNGTLFNEACAAEIDFFSISPKLASSTPPSPHDRRHSTTRINLGNIQSFITHARQYGKDFQLKFVYSSEHDAEEIKKILTQLTDWRNEDILLMPMGATPEELQRTIPKTLEHCIRNGWRYCDRLHLSLFGNKQGV